MTYEEKLKELRRKNSEIRKLKSETLKISQSIFDDFRGHIFDKYSELESFGWTQYTPYFNDGEACIFYANTDYIYINNECAEDSNWYSKENVVSWGTWNSESRSYEGRVSEPNDNYNQELVDACGEIVDFLGNFDNDFYLSKFGDHAEITVTKDSVDISDYDHD